MASYELSTGTIKLLADKQVEKRRLAVNDIVSGLVALDPLPETKVQDLIRVLTYSHTTSQSTHTRKGGLMALAGIGSVFPSPLLLPPILSLVLDADSGASMSLCLPQCPPLHITLNDISPSAMARDTLLLYMLGRTPPEGEGGREAHLQAVVDAWYGLQTTPEARGIMMGAVDTLVQGLASPQSVKELDLFNDGRSGLLSFHRDSDREAVLGEMVFWQGLPVDTPRQCLRDMRQRWKRAYLKDGQEQKKDYISVQLELASFPLMCLPGAGDYTAVLTAAEANLRSFCNQGVIRPTINHDGPYVLCPPALSSHCYPLSSRSFSSFPTEGVVPLSLGDPARLAVHASPNPVSALLMHTVSVYSQAVTGEGGGRALPRLLGVEMSVGDMAMVCDEMRLEGRRFSYIHGSCLVDRVGILPYLVHTVPLLRRGDPKRGVEPGCVQVKTHGVLTKTEDALQKWTGVPIHLFPQMLGCVPLSLTPSVTLGAPRPLEIMEANTPSGPCFLDWHSWGPTSTLMQRVPPMQPITDGCMRATPGLSTGDMAPVYAGLVRRAVPGGANDASRAISTLTLQILVRILLFALSDGRIRPDPGYTRGSPLPLGVPVLQYLMQPERCAKDWHSYKELVLVYKANGLAVPLGLPDVVPALLSVSLSGPGDTLVKEDTSVSVADGCVWGAGMCLLQSVSRGAPPPSVPGVDLSDKRPLQYAIRDNRGTGVGPNMELTLGVSGTGSGYCAIVDATIARNRLSVGVLHKVTVDVPMQPGQVDKMKALGVPKGFPTNYYHCPLSISHAYPVPSASVSVSPIQPLELNVPESLLPDSVANISWERGHGLRITVPKSTSIETATLAGDGPCRCIALRTESGKDISLQLLQPVSSVVQVWPPECGVLQATLAPTCVPPQALCIPNTLDSRDHLPGEYTLADTKPTALSVPGIEEEPNLPEGSMSHRGGQFLGQTVTAQWQRTLFAEVPQLVDRTMALRGDKTKRGPVGTDTIQWAMSKVPEESNLRQSLEANKTLSRMMFAAAQRGCNMPILMCGTSVEGVMCFERRPIVVVGQTVAFRGVAWCPPLPTEEDQKQAFGSTVMMATMRMLHNGRHPQMVEMSLPGTAQSLMRLQHDASTSVPHIMEGLDWEHMLPVEAFDEAEIPAETRQRWMRPIVLMARPCRPCDNIMSSFLRMGPHGVLRYALYKELKGNDVLDTHPGRALGLFYPTLWPDMGTRHPGAMVWSLYNDNDLKELADMDLVLVGGFHAQLPTATPVSFGGPRTPRPQQRRAPVVETTPPKKAVPEPDVVPPEGAGAVSTIDVPTSPLEAEAEVEPWDPPVCEYPREEEGHSWYNSLSLENCLAGNSQCHEHAYHYPFGNSVAVSFLNGIPHFERTGKVGSNPISILSLGAGDPRNLLQTLLSISLGIPDCPPLHITLNDISPSAMARDTLLLYMLGRTPPEGEGGRDAHLQAVVDAWYGLQTTPEARGIMMGAVDTLVQALASPQSVKELDLFNDGRSGLLSFHRDSDREAVLAEMVFWQGLPVDTPEESLADIKKGTEATVGRLGGVAEVVTARHLKTTCLTMMVNCLDGTDSPEISKIAADLDVYTEHCTIARTKRGRGGKQVKVETLCPPAYPKGAYPLTGRDFQSIPVEGLVPISIGDPKREDILASPNPVSAFILHSVGVWGDALCGRGQIPATRYLQHLEISVGDMAHVCDHMRLEHRTFAYIHASNIPDYVGLLPYLMQTVPLLRHGNIAKGIEPGVVSLRSFALLQQTEGVLERFTGVPIHMMPAVLGCVPLTLIPPGTKGAPRPIENYAINSPMGCTVMPPSRCVTELSFQRVVTGSGALPVAPSLCTGEMAAVFAGLIRRAVPVSGVNVADRRVSVFQCGYLVRLLLFALSDGRISPDPGYDSSSDVPLPLGLPVLTNMYETGATAVDLCHIDELLLTFRANGLATPLPTDVTPVIVTCRDLPFYTDAPTCLLQSRQSADEGGRCPVMEDTPAIQRSIVEKQGAGMGEDILVYLGLSSDAPKSFRVILPSSSAPHPCSVGVFHMRVMDVQVSPEMDLALKKLKASTEFDVPDNLNSAAASVYEMHPVDPQSISISPLTIPTYDLPSRCVSSARVVKEVSWASGHKQTVVLHPEVNVRSVTLVDPAPSRSLSLTTAHGHVLEMSMLQAVQTVTRVDTRHNWFTVELAPTPIAPQALSVPNALGVRETDSGTLHGAHDMVDPDRIQTPESVQKSREGTNILLMKALTGDLQAHLLYHVPGILDRVDRSMSALEIRVRRAQTEWALKTLPVASKLRHFLEAEDELGGLNGSVSRRTYSGPSIFTIAYGGCSEGLIVAEDKTFSVLGGMAAVRAVAFCPPIPPKRAEMEKVSRCVRAMVHALGGSSANRTTRVFEATNIGHSLFRLQQDAASCVPHLMKGFRVGTLLPKKKVNASIVPELRQWIQPIVLMSRPARLSTLFIAQKRMEAFAMGAQVGAKDSGNLADISQDMVGSEYIPATHSGRMLGKMMVRLWPDMETSQQQAVLMWTLYNDREVARLAEVDRETWVEKIPGIDTQEAETAVKPKTVKKTVKKGKGSKKGKLKFNFKGHGKKK
ncbi:hypothetical protein KIPB_001030 [Kipferlia bialata]|uniref:DUF4470 domain-containing protein n=1 Tax=Kipferlia bialata TaxID=797122 RepID=A0A9K3CQ43_9EUKA|nr:hypothetical protein KIPB_001030 [Kipferlia bialata]|eukprot:g1030.t1